jgi:hypothetical protein
MSEEKKVRSTKVLKREIQYDYQEEEEKVPIKKGQPQDDGDLSNSPHQN